jgi:hypothetical protein
MSTQNLTDGVFETLPDLNPDTTELILQNVTLASTKLTKLPTVHIKFILFKYRFACNAFITRQC